MSKYRSYCPAGTWRHRARRVRSASAARQCPVATVITRRPRRRASQAVGFGPAISADTIERNDRFLEDIVGVLFATAIVSDKRAGCFGVLTVDELDCPVQVCSITDGCYQFCISIFNLGFHYLVNSV